MTRTHCQLDIDENSFFLPYNWPFMAENIWSYHLGHFWAHLDPFGPFQTKLDFLLQTTLAKKHFVFLRRKIDFCLKRSKMVQMGPNGPKWSKTCYIDHLGPFWTTSGHWQACHVRPFLVPNLPFFMPPSHGFMAQWSQNGFNHHPTWVRDIQF